MTIKNTYQTRPIRFLELHEVDNWKVKIYSISQNAEFVKKEIVSLAKTKLSKWFKNSLNYPLATYKIATLILHEGKEGYFGILNWWIDENMLQNHVYLLENKKPMVFKKYSHKGIATCIWELEIIWFERNSWIEHVLKNPAKPNFDLYLQQHLNIN